jgi:hypothetical protein
MSRKLIVFGQKTFRITIPDDSKVTFGPWSPPDAGAKYATDKALIGTLRVYKGTKTTENILCVFSGVTGFREDTLNYEELVTKEEGALIWKSDEKGFIREEKVQRTEAWNPKQITEPDESDQDNDES